MGTDAMQRDMTVIQFLCLLFANLCVSFFFLLIHRRCRYFVSRQIFKGCLLLTKLLRLLLGISCLTNHCSSRIWSQIIHPRTLKTKSNQKTIQPTNSVQHRNHYQFFVLWRLNATTNTIADTISGFTSQKKKKEETHTHTKTHTHTNTHTHTHFPSSWSFQLFLFQKLPTSFPCWVEFVVLDALSHPTWSLVIFFSLHPLTLISPLMGRRN